MPEDSSTELTTITIKSETRTRLEKLCKTGQDLDDLINKLILLSSGKLADF